MKKTREVIAKLRENLNDLEKVLDEHEKGQVFLGLTITKVHDMVKYHIPSSTVPADIWYAICEDLGWRS